MTFEVIRGQGQGQEMTSVPSWDYFLGHLLRDDLKNLKNPVKMSVRTYVRPSVRPQLNTMQPQTK